MPHTAARTRSPRSRRPISKPRPSEKPQPRASRYVLVPAAPRGRLKPSPATAHVSAMKTPRRAALYLRVSTDRQTTDNQRIALTALCEQRGWQIVAEYADNGISGAKSREHRPGLDAALKDATRSRYDVLLAWSVDRLGRSLQDLIHGLQELLGARVDLVLHQQAIDTTTPAGRAMYQMLGVFAEFEREIIRARVNAGLVKARQRGARLGWPRVAPKVEERIRRHLARGESIHAVAKACRCGNSTVSRIKAAMAIGAVDVAAQGEVGGWRTSGLR